MTVCGPDSWSKASTSGSIGYSLGSRQSDTWGDGGDGSRRRVRLWRERGVGRLPTIRVV